MEKVIKGKLYDTEKSELVAKNSIFNFFISKEEIIEELYKTKKGEYFLYSFVINAISRHEVGGKLGENIKVLNLSQILKWYEKKQKDFSDEEKSKFLKEFGKFFIEA
ncbi:MAG: hypothetical protein PHI37_03695 [Candidatus Gracilibacteria bacterium]|nr:hypothetical protein [Candidatus Gracilibacteria bacterium]